MKIFALFLSALLLAGTCANAQKPANQSQADYIDKYKSLAIREMQLYKIPASITLAQGIIESNSGKSLLATEANNHFGIKCQKEWTGEKYLFDDDTLNECFRKYKNADESFRDHSLFLTSRSRYAGLFTLHANDYAGWAYGLKFTGYATNPEYAYMLIRTIEANRLYLYDDSVAAKPQYAATEQQPDNTVKPKGEPETKAVTAEPGVVYSSAQMLFRDSYVMPGPNRFEYAYTSNLGRKVYLNNGVHLIFAAEGDTWYSLAKEFKIYASQIYRQNDLKEKDPLTIGQIVYLEPKKKKGKESTCRVHPGESLYSISQEQGIRLKYLLQYNKMIAGDEPDPGFTLHLRSTEPRTSVFR